MSTIKAPFNFVPLNDTVFFPSWANQLSHDIPFKDSESGEIELKITAHSPIFIRNGHTPIDAENKNSQYLNFSNINGKYFIPSTSIKGELRSLVEILSFGKMNNISNDRYSLRDLKLKKEYLSFFQTGQVHCGWMKKEDNKILIFDHGIPRRISHKQVDSILGTTFSRDFTNLGFFNNEERKKSSLYKYDMVKEKNLIYKFRELPKNNSNSVDKRIMVVRDENGNLEGTIVFTGQPGVRKNSVKNAEGDIIQKGTGKLYEFVFSTKCEKVFTLDIDEKEGVYDDFCFIYNQSEEWFHWRKKIEKGESIPIFFSEKDGTILHIGLSYLYKLPYLNRVKNCLPKQHSESKADLSDCIFGSVQNNAIKGRVQVSHAFMIKGEIDNVIRKIYLSSPKSSYYPIYIQQNSDNGYIQNSFITMMSKDAKLKGRKYYPIHSNVSQISIPEGIEDKNLNHYICIKEGAEFVFKIKFANLLKVEIGAIIKAIKFTPTGFHSIGFAKPYGYGKVKIDILNTSGLSLEQHEYENAFIKEMSAFIPSYSKSPILGELLAMSIPQNTQTPLEYMSLEDFVSCKTVKSRNNQIEKPGEYLQYYSKLIKKQVVDQTSKHEEFSAFVTVLGRMPQAMLSESNDKKSYPLHIPESKTIRLKLNDKIIVTKDLKGGNTQRLVLVKKYENEK